MRQRDPRNVRDALLEAGHPPDEVEAMLAAAEAHRELVRLQHCFDKMEGLRFEDFARRAQSQARVAFRLIADTAPAPNAALSPEGMRTQQHLLDVWLAHARSFGFYV